MNSMHVTFKSHRFFSLWRLEESEQKVLFRIIAATPPFIVAAFVSDLGEITAYTGLTGFMITMIFPALLAYYSKQRLESERLSPRNQYSNIVTADFFVLFLFVVGITFTVLVICNLVL